MLCLPLSRVSRAFLGKTRGVRKLKYVDRFYRVNSPHRAESPTVINGVSKTSTSSPDDVTSVKSLEEMPGPEGLRGLPYIGSMFLFHPFTNYVPEKSNLLFEELHRKYGRIVKFRKGGKWSVLLYDPDLIEEAMSMEGKCPVRPSPPLADMYCMRTGKQKGISQVHGNEWQKMRRPVQAFLLQPANINQYVPQLDEVANDLVVYISQLRDDHGRIPLNSVMLRYAIESSAIYCINTRLGFFEQNNQPTQEQHHLQQQQQQQYHHPSSSSEHPSSSTSTSQCPYAHQGITSAHHQLEHLPAASSFRQLTDTERSQLMNKIKVYMKAVGDGYYTFPLYKFFRTRLYREFEDAANFISSVVQSRLSELVLTLKGKEGEGSNEVSDRPSLLQSLVSDGRLGLDSCTSMLSGFFSTATDNISNSLGIVLWHLAKNPDKQSKLREEIQERIPSIHHTPHEVLAHMPYLKCCLKESHRLTFPTALGSLRIMPEDITLGGYHIPAGTAVHFGHNCLGHSQEYFENPEEYIPERWLKQPGNPSDSALRRRQSVITLPFGYGARNCVGRRLAEIQIYLALIKILHTYEVRLADPNEELDIVYKITASSSRPLDIRFYPLPDAKVTSCKSEEQDAAPSGR